MARTVKQIRLVTFSTLYPNAVQPNHGVFVENRLRHLIASGEVVSRVVAPVPYFPFRSPGSVNMPPSPRFRPGRSVTA